MSGKVLTNELANLPHHDGQLVLEARRDDVVVKITCGLGVYHIVQTIESPCQGSFTRLAAERPTLEAAVELARQAYREGADFDTVEG